MLFKYFSPPENSTVKKESFYKKEFLKTDLFSKGPLASWMHVFGAFKRCWGKNFLLSVTKKTKIWASFKNIKHLLSMSLDVCFVMGLKAEEHCMSQYFWIADPDPSAPPGSLLSPPRTPPPSKWWAWCHRRAQRRKKHWTGPPPPGRRSSRWTGK